MKRFVAILMLFMAVALPAQALTPSVDVPTQLAQEEPAVVIDDSEGAPEDDAWTFRFLVPTLLVMTLALVVGLFAWYQLGFNRKYRVRDAE
ncbi:MAG: hypothetical protein HKN74_01965 [Acidimicrobiia bacterium]|nr:hypothetical protein [Acidimicrobiia bacterium]MBT8217504.1 hypothetical protein [Acidimicrobiia bacterium]NNF09027.1 hypothetical protein [Acidimicrobiia bacterium]NNL70066.1 hypothetical protein [Acidimicrobiia bacterium]